MQATAFDFATLPIQISATGPAKEGDWVHDTWRVTLSGKSGSWSTTYKTGTGHRKFPKGYRAEKTLRPGTLAFERQEAQKRAVTPAIADVVHSLILDASAADENFHDWCENYGYSDDSIKALNTYKQCLETAAALLKYLGRETLEKVREAVADM